MQRKETLKFVRSVSIHEGAGKIDLSKMLERWVIEDRVIGVQIASYDSALSPTKLGQLANRAFSIFPIPPEEISVSRGRFKKEDLKFTERFGYTHVPHFACLKMIDGVGIEAWISPVLLPPNHPLTARTSAAALSTDTQPLSVSRLKLEPPVLSFRELAYGRYVRLTVLDKLFVLASIASALGDQKINIKMMERPKTETGSLFAEMAFILSPCLGQNFTKALGKIRKLKVADGRKLCCAINTVLPVV